MVEAVIVAFIVVSAYVVYAEMTGQPVLSSASSFFSGLVDGGGEPSGVPVGAIVPSDPGTWPLGDRIWDICRAVAFAEGYNVPGSVSARLHNPGDLSDYAATYGSEYHSGSNVTIFPDEETGWQKLYEKFSNISQGVSRVYSADDTWIEIAQKYAGNWQAWVNNVTSRLGVDPDSTLAAYVNA